MWLSRWGWDTKDFVFFHFYTWLAFLFEELMLIPINLRYSEWVIFIVIPLNCVAINSEAVAADQRTVPSVKIEIISVIHPIVNFSSCYWEYNDFGVESVVSSVAPRYGTDSSYQNVFACFCKNQKRTLIVAICMELIIAEAISCSLEIIFEVELFSKPLGYKRIYEF